MTYQQTLDYMYAQLPMFSRIGTAAYKSDLTNTIRICEYLGNPHKKFKSVHIAGTNGKGSTSHMLSAIFQTAGYNTGLYTSPHLKDFRERIKVNGEMITEEFVVDFVERLQPLIKEISPSFFEITVAMAFEYFAWRKTDIAIIETGLGGRLDSTNIITPEIAIITNVGYDHMNLLGDTLEKIAYEKAGIFKPGIVALVGEQLPETSAVFKEKARQENAALHIANQIRYIADWKFNHHHLSAEVARTNSDEKTWYTLDLPGIYQSKNLLTVLTAVDILNNQGWRLEQRQVHKALAHVKKLTGLHGRWETIHEHPDVILDVAHNEDGIRAVAAQLELTTFHHLRIVLGMVKDKEIEKVLGLLPESAIYYFTRAQIPRALPEDQLAEKAATFGLNGQHHPEVNAALKAALAQADRDDLILVCGSVFVVGEVERP